MLTCLCHHVNNSSTSRDCIKRNLWICGIRGNSSYCEYCILPKSLWLMRLFLAWSFRSAPCFSCHTNRSSQSQERGGSWLWWTGKYTVFENGTCKMGQGRIEECVFGCLRWPERTPWSYETQDLNWPDTFVWIYCQKKSNNTAWEQSKTHKSRQVSVIEIPHMPWCTEEQA